MFVTRSGGNYVDYSIPVGSLVIIIIGLLAVGGLWYLQNKIRSAIIANTCISISGTPTAPSEAAAIPCRHTPSG